MIADRSQKAPPAPMVAVGASGSSSPLGTPSPVGCELPPARPPGPRANDATMIEVDHALVTRLRPEAARRDVPVNRLLHDLLDVIAADQLTTAILDDGDPGLQGRTRS